ncbi:MAG: RNA polymerase sigma factor, RpoD/SigA family [Prochlorococcaceae cyanobacterium]
MTSSLARPSTGPPRRRSGSTDLVRLYLQDIGRVDLLSQEEELTLARLVQRREILLASRRRQAAEEPLLERLIELEELRQRLSLQLSHLPSSQQWAEAAETSSDELRSTLQQASDRWAELQGVGASDLKQALHHGRRAKERMIQANLRLVVAVAKKYQQRGLELLDLVQEGTLGLERAVERYDPTRGFRFSTYAYWWIRQGITRAIATQSRTIRLPVHVTEKLNRIKKAQREFSARTGRLASLPELAAELGLSQDTLRLTLMRVPRAVSLDVRVGKDQDTDLGDLLEDPQATPEQQLTRRHLHSDLEGLLAELSGREAEVIRQRFGLADDQPRTLAQIGDNLQLSRERVRQIESRALLKLRQPQSRCKVRDYLQTLE